MTTSILLVALLAASPKAVTIFVGPVVRDGFVDVDKGVLDSIKDIQTELRRNRSFAVVPSEASAQLKLFVASRAKVPGTGTPISTGTGTVVGGVAIASGTTVTEPDSRIDAVLRVGTYEKAFVGQSDARISGTWGRCAKLLVEDLTIWVNANRERLSQPEAAAPAPAPKP
jgi:hypothetical protein